MPNTIRLMRTGLAKIVLVVLVIVAIVLVNLIASRLTCRVDLTRDKRFSLAEVSIQVARELPGEVRVEAFFSSNMPPQLEQLRRDTNDMLAEYAAHSNGKLNYLFVDPGASEADRERASSLNLPNWPLEQHSESELSVRYVFSGIALTYDTGSEERVEIIPQALPGMNMEYELTRALRTVSSERGKTVLGVIYGDGGMFDEFVDVPFNPQNPIDPRELISNLEEQLQQLFEDLYDFRLVDIREGPIPEEIEGLFVMGPRESYDAEMKYRLDQFIMRGRPVALFVSPYRRETPQELVRQGLGHLSLPAMNVTGLETLLQNYGVIINQDAIFDFERAQISAQRQEGSFGGVRAIQWVPYLDPRLPELTARANDSVLVTNMNMLAFLPTDRSTPLSQSSLSLSAQARDAIARESLRVTTVLETSPTSRRLVGNAERTYETLRGQDLEQHVPSSDSSGELGRAESLQSGPFSVALTVEGRFDSAFPERADSSRSADSDEEDLYMSLDQESEEEWEHLARTDDGRLLVIANGTWLRALLIGSDPLLARETQMMLPGQVRNTVNQYRISSIIFMRNIADWLAQDSDLVRIRTRGQAAFVDLSQIGDGDKRFYQVFNIAGVPLIFVLLGVGGLVVRRVRQASISARYQGNKQ